MLSMNALQCQLPPSLDPFEQAPPRSTRNVLDLHSEAEFPPLA
jgi:hypothetical protein